MTFSVAARCPSSGMVGIAVSTAIPAVGALCPFGAPAAGVVVTQSWVNPYLGLDGVERLRAGLSAGEVLDDLLAEDPEREMRQLGVVDSQGRSAAFTGSGCTGWAGHLTGPGWTVQGNMLTSGATLEEMRSTLLATDGVDLPERLLQVLESGQRVGGDKRGRQSAALLVIADEAYPWVDLRVDEHTHPVGELRRVWEVARRQLLPFVATLPTRDDPSGRQDQDVVSMVLRRPEDRPGGRGDAPA